MDVQQPDRILGHLAAGHLVQQAAADMAAPLGLEQPDARGVRGIGDRAGRLDQPRLDHAGGFELRAFEADPARRPQAGRHQQDDQGRS